MISEQRRAHLREIGLRGGEATKAKYEREGLSYKALARLGGKATKGIKKPRKPKPEPPPRSAASIVTDTLDEMLRALER